MSKYKKTVTVLMPVYNGEKFIRAAIDSILAQTFHDFELLIINDGSTDKTGEIINSYTDTRIRCINQENKGVSRSLNVGLRLIETKYIRRHDADDISEPWMLQWQIDYLEANPNIAAIATRCNFMTVNGKISPKHFHPKKHIFGEKEIIFAQRKHFYPYCPIVHSTVMGQTRIFKQLNGYRTEFLTSEDNDLWLRMMENNEIAISIESPYKVRLSPNSATKTHKSTGRFFRELALIYAEERKIKGSDPIMRMEKIENIEYDCINDEERDLSKRGLFFPSVILGFSYQVSVASKDFKSGFSDIINALKIGWRLKKTYQAILYPILGDRLLALGVSIKKMFR